MLGDAVSDEPHQVEPFDSAVGWFVDVPDLDGCAVVGCDLSVAAEYDDEVGLGDEVLGELFGVWSAMLTPTSSSV